MLVRAQCRRSPQSAARILAVAVPIAKEQLSGFQQANPRLAAAAIAAATERERIAARLLGAFNQYGGRTGFVNVSRDHEHLVSRLHDRLGAAIVEDELARGTETTDGEADPSRLTEAWMCRDADGRLYPT